MVDGVDKQGVFGSVTVYSAISMFLVAVMLSVLLEDTRNHAVNAVVQTDMADATEILLGNYCKELFDRYGLLFFDGSYGSDMLRPSDIENQWDEYLQYSNSLNSGFYLLGYHPSGVHLDEIRTAVDSDGMVFLDSVFQYEKYASLDSLIEKLKTYSNCLNVGVDELNSVQNEINREKEGASDETKNVFQAPDHFGQEGNEDIEISDFDISDPNVFELLYEILPLIVYPKFWEISHASTVIEDPPSDFKCQEEKDFVASLNAVKKHFSLQEEDVNFLKKISFCDYVMQNFDSFLTKSETEEKKGICYEIEYIIVGNSSDSENMKAVISFLVAERTAMNCSSIKKSEKRMETVRDVADALSKASKPELKPVYEAVLIFLWSYVEAVFDARDLLKGKKVALVKPDSDWKTDLNGIVQLVKKKGTIGFFEILSSQKKEEEETILKEENETDRNESGGVYLGYTDYLMVMCFMADIEDNIYNCMDVIQDNIRMDFPSFSMKNMISSFRFSLTVEEGRGIFVKDREISLLGDFHLVGKKRVFHDEGSY